MQQKKVDFSLILLNSSLRFTQLQQSNKRKKKPKVVKKLTNHQLDQKGSGKELKNSQTTID